jgi:hypothetical protein
MTRSIRQTNDLIGLAAQMPGRSRLQISSWSLGAIP